MLRCSACTPLPIPSIHFSDSACPRPIRQGFHKKGDCNASLESGDKSARAIVGFAPRTAFEECFDKFLFDYLHRTGNRIVLSGFAYADVTFVARLREQHPIVLPFFRVKPECRRAPNQIHHVEERYGDILAAIDRDIPLCVGCHTMIDNGALAAIGSLGIYARRERHARGVTEFEMRGILDGGRRIMGNASEKRNRNRAH